MYYGTAGLSGSIEDYQSAYAAYLADHRKWVSEQAQYGAQNQAYINSIAAHDAWAARDAQYEAAYRSWQSSMASASASAGACEANQGRYDAALRAWTQARDTQNANYRNAISLVEERNTGYYAPAGMSCVPASTHATYVQQCDAARTAVRGLGALMTDPCMLMQLPVCVDLTVQHPGARPAACQRLMPPEPQGPGAEPVVLSPPNGALVRPEPMPPVPPAGVEELPDANTVEKKKASMVVGGIILLLVIAGGYSVYKVTKK